VVHKEGEGTVQLSHQHLPFRGGKGRISSRTKRKRKSKSRGAVQEGKSIGVSAEVPQEKGKGNKITGGGGTTIIKKNGSRK